MKMISIVAAILAVILFIGISIIQLLLALGLPLGHLAYGGKYEKLPTNLRIMSLIAIGIFTFASIAVLSRAGIIIIFTNQDIAYYAVWIIAGYLTFNTLLNVVSRSKGEKRIMTPISLTIAICCYIVAIGA